MQLKRVVLGVGNTFLVPRPSDVLNLQQSDVNTFINCSSSSSLEVLRVYVDNSSENKLFDIQNNSQFVLDIVKDSPTSFSPVNFSNKVTSTPHKDVSNNRERFMSSTISYVDKNNIDSENELSYDSVLSSPGSLASDVTDIYENTSVPQCDSSRESTYSSENISVLSDRTYIYNISSNETSIETLNRPHLMLIVQRSHLNPVISQIVRINRICRLVILTHLYMTHQVLTHKKVCSK